MQQANLPGLDDLDVANKRVLVRGDLNVPLDDGRITDDFRIRAFEPTLVSLREKGARVVVCSHLGRPKGSDDRYTLAPVADALGIDLAHGVVGDATRAAMDALQAGDALMLENLRFEPGETKNDPAFVEALCALVDAYVNDAFGACHRTHASVIGPPSRLPSAAGPLLLDEVANLTKLLDSPERPYVVVLGGAKVADKIGIVRNLLRAADRILIGGGMCFTFLKAMGAEIGKSMIDDDHLADVRELLGGVDAGRLMLPTDIVAATGIDAETGDVFPARELPADRMGLDIGPESAAAFAAVVRDARTVFWNGPMGVFENPAFLAGSKAIAEAVAACDGYTVTGGGDTAAVLATVALSDAVDFASTGGGASLEFLEGRTLPGIDALIKGRHG